MLTDWLQGGRWGWWRWGRWWWGWRGGCEAVVVFRTAVISKVYSPPVNITTNNKVQSLLSHSFRLRYWLLWSFWVMLWCFVCCANIMWGWYYDGDMMIYCLMIWLFESLCFSLFQSAPFLYCLESFQIFYSFLYILAVVYLLTYSFFFAAIIGSYVK